MREDMAQVIIERPRIRHSWPTKRKGYDRDTARLGWENAVKREGIKVRSGGQKILNENLAPLRRYLATQVGRPWNVVHADVCRYLDRSNPVQDHVRDHLDNFVAVHVMQIEGELLRADGYGVGFPIRTPLYVCPRSGILKRTRRVRTKRSIRAPKIHLIPIGDGTALVRRQNAWFVVHFNAMPPQDPRRIAFFDDCLVNRSIVRSEALQIYGCPRYVTFIRPARKCEVRRAVSSYPYTNRVH